MLLAIAWLTAHPHRAQKLNSVSAESSAMAPLVDEKIDCWLTANANAVEVDEKIEIVDEKIEIVAIAA